MHDLQSTCPHENIGYLSPNNVESIAFWNSAGMSVRPKKPRLKPYVLVESPLTILN